MRLLFATGGTGGHINPALAVAGRIKKKYGKEAEILFVGTQDRMESRLVPAAGYDFKTIEITGFYRGNLLKNIGKNLHTLELLLKSSRAAEKIIKEFNPDVVIGFGGYVSGPVLRAAAKLHIPTAIHEQNAFPGITNKALAKRVDLVMLTSADAKDRMQSKNEPVITGLPVRDELISSDRDIARASLGVPDGMPLVLSMGGSLGANAINEAVCGLIASKKDDYDCYFLHATGQYGLWVPEKLHELGVNFEDRKDIEIREYINDMQVCMPAADIIIGRAGATSLYEIRALGKASILIPSPNVAENHQFYNAMELVNNNAALIIEEKDLTPERLKTEVDRLINDRKLLAEIEENAKKMAIPNTTDVIVENILNLIHEDK